MVKRRTWHVSPKGKKWQVKREGAVYPAKLHRKKSAAIRTAKRLAKKARLGQIKVHKKNGRFDYERTYGKDPKRYRG